MHVCHCMIELHNDARALAFAAAVEQWMSHLQDRGLIADWRLMRRTLGLAAGAHTDFILEITLPGFAALDDLFATLANADDDSVRRYDLVHQMIARADSGLYRPFPDPHGCERIALV
ncbi:MAG: hypothetical protein H3C51_09465 [Rubellimicrobium sp.]|nr:hypothetical protein [Rubellimicrobium sp.]